MLGENERKLVSSVFPLTSPFKVEGIDPYNKLSLSIFDSNAQYHVLNPLLQSKVERLLLSVDHYCKEIEEFGKKLSAVPYNDFNREWDTRINSLKSSLEEEKCEEVLQKPPVAIKSKANAQPPNYGLPNIAKLNEKFISLLKYAHRSLSALNKWSPQGKSIFDKKADYWFNERRLTECRKRVGKTRVDEREIKDLDQRMQSIAIGIITTFREHRGKMILTYSTWARKPFLGRDIFVYSDDNDNENIGVIQSPCGNDYRAGLCCKTDFLLKDLYQKFPKKNWFVRAMDDTVVVLENLVRYLETLDHTKPIVIAMRQCLNGRDGNRRYEFVENVHGEKCYPQGGSGWIVSNGFMKKAQQSGIDFMKIAQNNGLHADDVHFGEWLNALGVPLYHYRGISNNLATVQECQHAPTYCPETPDERHPYVPMTFHQKSWERNELHQTPRLHKTVQTTGFTATLIELPLHHDVDYWRICPCEFID
eukprot:TRINITY_DN2180_c0_g2_i2.p1 TRINITY_DN2180_c0_g2~~TRINITY_DN2180_c0_g2_i2.p1  ORF type:complete len:477 (-),score=99.29 TRINITY_DN2180_c0_g2_i2:162-1592(-)